MHYPAPTRSLLKRSQCCPGSQILRHPMCYSHPWDRCGLSPFLAHPVHIPACQGRKGLKKRTAVGYCLVICQAACAEQAPWYSNSSIHIPLPQCNGVCHDILSKGQCERLQTARDPKLWQTDTGICLEGGVTSSRERSTNTLRGIEIACRPVGGRGIAPP